MEKVPVIIEWASDGGIGAMMKEESFSGLGDTVEAAIEDMKEGVRFFIETAKEMGFPYKEYLDGDYEIEIEYDVQSMLQYARHYMTDAGIGELTNINPVQIARYATGQAKPRQPQKRKIIEAFQRFGTAFAAISL